MERKLTKKELIKEMMSQVPTELNNKEIKVESDDILDDYNEDDIDDLKEARARIYGTSQTTEIKRLYRLFNKLNN